MRAWLVAALGLAGCANVWGLTTDHGPPDAPPIDAPIDAPTDAFVCTAQKVTLPLVEDAEMIAGQPTQGHGTEPILNVGVAEVILKFDVTNLPPNTQRFTLTLPLVEKANDCAAGCGSCLPIDKPGTIRVAYLRSDWAEATANYKFRSGSLPWQLDGANGASDRGQVQDTAPFSIATPFAITFTATDVGAWVATSTKRLSLVVSPFDNATMIIRQHEAWTQPCVPVPAVPTLTADPCP